MLLTVTIKNSQGYAPNLARLWAPAAPSQLWILLWGCALSQALTSPWGWYYLPRPTLVF